MAREAPAWTLLMNLQRLPANLYGRDFVVGDLHGERAWLLRELDALQFDTGRDRLFSVGDLIDRGSNSLGCLQLLDEPWFHAVLGNHEAMMIAARHSDNARFDWLRHGGEWAEMLGSRMRDQWVDRLERLPHVLVVGEGPARFHLVHAELTDPVGLPVTDSDLDNRLRTDRWTPERLLWSTAMASRFARTQQGNLPSAPVRHGLSATFCGHVPVTEPGWYHSHYFLDGGAGYDRPLANGSAPRLHVRAVAPLVQQYQLALVRTPAPQCAPPVQQAASQADSGDRARPGTPPVRG